MRANELEASGPLSWPETADLLREALRIVELEIERGPSKLYPRGVGVRLDYK